MLEIKNTQVYGLEDTLYESKFPMQVGEPKDIVNNPLCIDFDDLKTPKKLASCKSGSGHDCYLKGITVKFHLKNSLYFTKQLQRYHFIDFVSSQSTMHCITEMDIEQSCNEFVDSEVIAIINKWINLYNNFDKEIQRLKDIANNSGGLLFEEAFDMYPQNQICVTVDGEKTWMKKEEIYMRIISNLPSGFEYWAAMTTNYLQLKNIYKQRRNHKLPDWQVFCDWIEELPIFKKLIGAEKSDS